MTVPSFASSFYPSPSFLSFSSFSLPSPPFTPFLRNFHDFPLRFPPSPPLFLTLFFSSPISSPFLATSQPLPNTTTCHSTFLQPFPFIFFLLVPTHRSLHLLPLVSSHTPPSQHLHLPFLPSDPPISSFVFPCLSPFFKPFPFFISERFTSNLVFHLSAPYLQHPSAFSFLRHHDDPIFHAPLARHLFPLIPYSMHSPSIIPPPPLPLTYILHFTLNLAGNLLRTATQE